MGCFVYVLLGSCKDVPMGPSAISSLLTFQSAGGVWQKAVLLSFLSGIVELMMGLFGLGFLVNFVSGPVSSGYTSAVSLIILSSQVKDLLGIPGSGQTFVEMWRSIIENIHLTRVSDTILGVTCIIVLLLMRVSGILYHNSSHKETTVLREIMEGANVLFLFRYNSLNVNKCLAFRFEMLTCSELYGNEMYVACCDRQGPINHDNLIKKFQTLTMRKPCSSNASKCALFFDKILWLIGTARNAILVVLTGGLAFICYQYDQKFFKIIGDIPPGLPQFQAPPFSLPDVRNETTGEIITKGETFTEMVSSLGSGIIVVPLIALLENIAVCKAFGATKFLEWFLKTKFSQNIFYSKGKDH